MRQAQHGGRFNQARLDRSYNSERMDWFEYVREVLHGTTQTLSDHQPMVTRIALTMTEEPCRKCSLYMKMDVTELRSDGTKEKVKAAWEEQMKEGRDVRFNWEIGWKAIKKVLLEVQRSREAVEERREKPTFPL